MGGKQNIRKKNKTPIKLVGIKPSYSGVIYAGIIFAFTFILYGNTLKHSYALDDDIVSRNNVFVQQGFHGIPSLFSKGSLFGFNQKNEGAYRPVTLMTMAVETAIWGEKTSIHHFFNVLYYAIACVLLFFIIRRFFRTMPLIFPLIIVLLFAAHPIHTESVANFKSRDEILSFLFLQGMLLGICHFIDTRKFTGLIVTILCFIAALLSKENAISYLLLLPLVLIFFTNAGWKRIAWLFPVFLVIVGMYVVMRWIILDTMTFQDHIPVLNNALVAATNSADRLATSFFILGKYMLLLVFPHPLSFDYSYRQIPIVSFTDPYVIITLAIYLGMAGYAVLKFRARDILSFCFIYFIITLSVVSNLFLLIGSTMGERFLFTPSLAFCISIAVLLARLTRTDFSGKVLKNRIFFLAVIAIIIALYSFKTISRNFDWKNNLTLFEADSKSSPNSTRVHASLAHEYMSMALSGSDPAEKQKYYTLGKMFFEKSLDIYPANSYALYNYGDLEYAFGKLSEAELLYHKTIMIEPKDYKAWTNLGFLAFKLEHYDSALVYFNKLLEFDTTDARVIGTIGVLYQRKHNYSRALEYHKKAFANDPSNEILYQNLVSVYTTLKDTANLRYYAEQKARYKK